MFPFGNIHLPMIRINMRNCSIITTRVSLSTGISIFSKSISIGIWKSSNFKSYSTRSPRIQMVHWHIDNFTRSILMRKEMYEPKDCHQKNPKYNNPDHKKRETIVWYHFLHHQMIQDGDEKNRESYSTKNCIYQSSEANFGFLNAIGGC